MFSLLSEPNQTKAVIVSGALKELIESWQEYTPILNDASHKLISAFEGYLDCKSSDKTYLYDEYYKGTIEKNLIDLDNSRKRLEDAIFNVEFIKKIDSNAFYPLRKDLYVGSKIYYKLYWLNSDMQQDAHHRKGEAPSLNDIEDLNDRSEVSDIRAHGDKRFLKLGNKLFNALC